MAVTVNSDLWREAREAGTRHGRDLPQLIGTPRTVLNLFLLSPISRPRLRNVSRLWIERHGERAAGVVSALLNRLVKLEDLFPDWDRPDERPLGREERERLRQALGARWGELTAREAGVLRLTFGLEGQPMSLARVAVEMGVTRERVRQIEAAALEKLGVRLPRGRHKATVARRLRARQLLRTLIAAAPDSPSDP
jgi:RNA polymerase sigma factor (sigma-70 family)